MKRTMLFLLAALFATASCEIEGGTGYSNEEEVDGLLQEAFWTQAEVPEYEVVSKKILSPEEMAEIIFKQDETDDDDLRLEAKEKFLEQCRKQQEELRREDPNVQLWFGAYIFYYRTRDHQNKEILMSAFLGYAIESYFDDTPKEQEHIAFCCPYTHTLEKECASEDHGGYEFSTMFSKNLFIMPDGQGFGSNKDHTQTYLNHNLHAQQYYDALIAGCKVYSDYAHGKMKSNWTLRVFGASQGAGDAIALHRYLDTTNKRVDLTPYYQSKDANIRKIADDLCKKYSYPKGTKYIRVPIRDIHRFEYSYVCCGPYCPETTMQSYSSHGSVSYPCVVPLVIKSMFLCYYPELHDKKGYEEEDFFSYEWNQNKADFDNIYLKKTKKSDELNKYIVKKLGAVNPLRLKKILSDDMATKPDSQIYRDLMTCLKEQDLTTGWTPKTKTILVYNTNDEVVPYDNTVRLAKLFEDSNCPCELLDGSEIKGISVDHVKTCMGYILSSWDR